jgi:hypothetical protein
MKCRNLAFNAQGSRVVIESAQEGAVKIYVAAPMEALRKKRSKQVETQFSTKKNGAF